MEQDRRAERKRGRIGEWREGAGREVDRQPEGEEKRKWGEEQTDKPGWEQGGRVGRWLFLRGKRTGEGSQDGN